MASDVNIHAPAYPPSLLLGMWDNVSSPRPTPGALALTVVDTISRLQQSTQQQSTWELVLFYILLFPIIYLDNISSSSFIPVTHLMSDGPSSFLPPLEFTASAHAIDPLSVRNAKSGIGPDPIRIWAVLRREVCLNFGFVGCRLICWMFDWITSVMLSLFSIWIFSLPISSPRHAPHVRRASLILPPLEFTASAHAIDPLSVRNEKSGIGPDPIRIRAVLRREVCLNFGSVGCRLICLMFGKCVGVFDCICSRFYPAISSQRNATVGGTRVYALLV